ncbi:MAG: D-alanyl-D-alanine carboxypeptidase [Spirochaetaceae bacterium]|jgi:D-alanyl-D-alanine carboxypeptidase (penicillin-binding protein 5/6)|nr:D-alanyl-D-alanine carboxypeptidase [Spirochaetaceae bacterium]
MKTARVVVPASVAGAFFCVVLGLSPAVFAAADFPSGRDDFLALTARAAVLTDAASGDVLYAKNPDEVIAPASLTKLMTIHVAQRLAAVQDVSLDAPVPLPPESWAVNQPPRSSLMFLAQGQIVSLRELFLGLAIPSGNDAAVAVALRFAPTTGQFASLMNSEAARLGLTRTRFVEPSGISEYNSTTAREFAVFCREYIRAHRENLRLYHTAPEFAYPKAENVSSAQKRHPGTIVQGNHISILARYPGADGLKTGYIDEAGYNLAATAERDGTRFIAVILGVPAELGLRRGDSARTEDAVALLDFGFANFKTVRQPLPPLREAKVWKGRKNRLPVIPARELVWTIPAGRGDELWLETWYAGNLVAPLPAGVKAGEITLVDGDGALASIDLLTAAPVERAGLLKRALHSVAMAFRGISR